mmetsp:Transcript_14943/g.34684  ORF Transcript_14943/g.34684 Transcript_14943/m.34684 type:complete len:265 (-) Transcript_14943:1693-2487(-)
MVLLLLVAVLALVDVYVAETRKEGHADVGLLQRSDVIGSVATHETQPVNRVQTLDDRLLRVGRHPSEDLEVLEDAPRRIVGLVRQSEDRAGHGEVALGREFRHRGGVVGADDRAVVVVDPVQVESVLAVPLQDGDGPRRAFLRALLAPLRVGLLLRGCRILGPLPLQEREELLVRLPRERIGSYVGAAVPPVGVADPHLLRDVYRRQERVSRDHRHSHAALPQPRQYHLGIATDPAGEGDEAGERAALLAGRPRVLGGLDVLRR